MHSTLKYPYYDFKHTPKITINMSRKALPSPLINLANIFNAAKNICIENAITKRSLVFDWINFSGTGF